MIKSTIFALKLPIISIRSALLIAASLVLAMIFAALATPKLIEVGAAPNLNESVPHQFGDWRELTNPYAQVSLATGTDAELNQPYDQVVMRTYANGEGKRVMLALAWGMRQRQEVKVHRPDLCYVAQGYKVIQLSPATYSVPGGDENKVYGKRMLAVSGRDTEAVAYWIRIGSLYSENAFETRIHILKEGLAGRIPDGILVRASQKLDGNSDPKESFALLDRFLSELVEATPPTTRALLVKG